MNFPLKRQLRLRTKDNLRDLIKEVSLDFNQLVYPLILKEGINNKQEIKFLPGQYFYDFKSFQEELENLVNLGINKIFLISNVDKKSKLAAHLSHPLSLTSKAIRYIKKNFPDIFVIADICLSSATQHGQCVILTDDGDIDNDTTLVVLTKIALAYAEAGADAISISSPVDGKVKAVRSALDNKLFFNIPIFANSLRYYSYLDLDILDRKDINTNMQRGYKLDYRNLKEALVNVQLDINDGVDVLMIRPSLQYLDIIKSVKEYAPLPLAAFNTEVEYYMAKSLVKDFALDEVDIVKENFYTLKRAGVDFIISYHTKDVYKWLKSGKW